MFDVAAPLSFAVWDHDKIGMNDSLGNGEILLAHCSPGTPTALRVALSTQGTVEVVVDFLPSRARRGAGGIHRCGGGEAEGDEKSG